MTGQQRSAIVRQAGEGRHYGMGKMRAVFKADGAEGNGQYAISEWWLEADSTGPGVHSHPEDDLFYVLEGTMSFWLADHWVDAGPGAFILVPGGVAHDFQNRSAARAGMLNISSPGDFEQHMPSIVDWFAEHPPGSTSGAV